MVSMADPPRPRRRAELLGRQRCSAAGAAAAMVTLQEAMDGNFTIPNSNFLGYLDVSIFDTTNIH